MVHGVHIQVKYPAQVSTHASFKLLWVNSILYNYIITVQCQLPILNNHVIVKSDNSSAEMGSVLCFKCKHGLIPEDYVVSVCSSGGLWLPDPEKHNCHPLMATITTEFYPGDVYY